MSAAGGPRWPTSRPAAPGGRWYALPPCGPTWANVARTCATWAAAGYPRRLMHAFMFDILSRLPRRRDSPTPSGVLRGRCETPRTPPVGGWVCAVPPAVPRPIAISPSLASPCVDGLRGTETPFATCFSSACQFRTVPRHNHCLHNRLRLSSAEPVPRFSGTSSGQFRVSSVPVPRKACRCLA